MSTRSWIPTLGLLLLFAVASVALAASAGDYDLYWRTVDAGGSAFSGDGRYALGSTTGQPDASLLEAGGYSLAGGFWATHRLPLGHRYLLPLILKSY